MTKWKWAPSELAVYDQYLAKADDNVKDMAAELKRHMDADGEPTALAELTVLLLGQSDAEALVALLVVALRRVAMSERQQE